MASQSTKDNNSNKLAPQPTINTIANNNDTKQQKSLKKIKYVPPHLRGKGIKTLTKLPSTASHKHTRKHRSSDNRNPYSFTTKHKPMHSSDNNENQCNNSNTFEWYTNEKAFELKLGISLQTFKLNVPSYKNEQLLTELTNINTAKDNLHKPTLLCVFGPPATGKSTVYSHYLSDFGIKDAVNTDGDMVRQSHYGIQKYLQMCSDLNIGYDGFFRKYCQHWSSKWKYEIRQKAMEQRQNIIAFSTCHRSNECIEEINGFYENGYCIKVLLICADYDKCQQFGVLRERVNGRKYLNAAYLKSMQGCMDVIDYLLRNGRVYGRDLMVVRNRFEESDRGEQLNDMWRNIRNKVLIPMRKRGKFLMYKNT